MLTEDLKPKYNTLTDRQKMYYDIMNAKSGVLYITAKPGIAKSAIARAIATKMGFQYMDVRLSMIDETDVGLFPSLSELETEEGGKMKVLDFVVPKWAVKANQAPTIIHFEELNRANLNVRNAALQILLERCIGTEFKFNDNVFMMASGNLGAADGTDVEELDEALNNRLIHVAHELTIPEWVEDFARQHIYKPITQFIEATPTAFYVPNENTEGGNRAYATPRSWTFLSDYIINKFGKDAPISNEILADLSRVAPSFIGAKTAGQFDRWATDFLKLSITDILNNYKSAKEKLKHYQRDRITELVQNLKEYKFFELTNKQAKNAAEFLADISVDEAAGYLAHFTQEEIDMDEDLEKNPEKLDKVKILTHNKALRPIFQKIAEQAAAEEDGEE